MTEEIPICNCCGCPIDDQEGPFCESCAKLDAVGQLDLRIRNMDNDLRNMIEDLNLGNYELEDSDCCILMGRLRAADAVLLDTLNYLNVVKNTMEEDENDR
jgi:hypothetical protein